MAELSELLEQLERKLGALAGEPSELEGGITNRNLRVSLGGREYVLRRPGKDTELLGIDRDAERIASETAARLGIGPQVAAALGDCLVTRFIACRPLSERELAERVEEIAAALRLFHDSAVALGVNFVVSELLVRYASIVASAGGSLPDAYGNAVGAVARIEAALPLARRRPCHNDLLAANIVRDLADERLVLLDWEYAAMGDPRFDLANLSVNNGFDEATDERLLRAYGTGVAPSARVRAAHSLMKVLSDAREAAWGVVQSAVSELDFDFTAYAREHLERLDAAVAAPQFERWLADASA